MKKMKKIIGLLVALAVIFVSCISVSAYSWTSSSNGHECDDGVADTRNTVYHYLCDNTSLNKAAICGIMGNIWAECCFNVNETYGSYHGLCQWGGGRWSNCQNYCYEHGYNSNSVTGQVSFLVYELKNEYPNTYRKLQGVSNSEDGVYDAESIFRINYEGCGEQAMSRRQAAAINYWYDLPSYNGSDNGTVKEETTKTTTAKPQTTAPDNKVSNEEVRTVATTTKVDVNKINAQVNANVEKRQVKEVYNAIAQVFEQVMMPSDSVLPNS